MPEHILKRAVIVGGIHRKVGEKVSLNKSDAAYFSGHKISSEVVHRDTVNVPAALPPMKPAPVDDDEELTPVKTGVPPVQPPAKMGGK
jgi:hypothetical protein